jgi:hypothetical protein
MKIVRDEATSAMIVKSSVTYKLGRQKKRKRGIRCILGRKSFAKFAESPKTVPASRKINTVDKKA